MKIWKLYFFSILFFLSPRFSYASTSLSAYSQTEAMQQINRGYESTVRPILEKSCTACHSSNGKMPWFYQVPLLHNVMDQHVQAAREHIEFTARFPFHSQRTATEDLQLLAVTIRQDLMPPRSYRWTHRESVLSENEKRVILQWIENSQLILDSNHFVGL